MFDDGRGTRGGEGAGAAAAAGSDVLDFDAVVPDNGKPAAADEEEDVAARALDGTMTKLKEEKGKEEEDAEKEDGGEKKEEEKEEGGDGGVTVHSASAPAPADDCGGSGLSALVIAEGGGGGGEMAAMAAAAAASCPVVVGSDPPGAYRVPSGSGNEPSGGDLEEGWDENIAEGEIAGAAEEEGLSAVLERYGIHQTEAVAVALDDHRDGGEDVEDAFSDDEDPEVQVRRASDLERSLHSSPAAAPLASAVPVEEGKWASRHPRRLACAVIGVAVLLAVGVTAGVLVSSRSDADADQGGSQEKSDSPGGSDASGSDVPSTAPTTPPSTPAVDDADLPEWVQIGPDIIGQLQDEQSGYVALATPPSGGAPILAVGGVGTGVGGGVDGGVVRTYRVPRGQDNGGSAKNETSGEEENAGRNATAWNATAFWEQIGNDVPGPKGGVLYSGFGSSLNLTPDGTAFATGAPFWNFFTGAAHVFWYDPTEDGWVRRGQEILPEAEDAAMGVTLFGSDVTLSSDGTRLGLIGNFPEVSFLRVYDVSGDGKRWERVGPDYQWHDGGEGGNNTQVLFDHVATASGDRELFAIRSEYGARVLRLLEREDAAAAGQDAEYEWVQLGGDIPQVSDSASGYASGYLTMSADGTTVAVSDHHNDNASGENAGFVHVHRLDPETGEWTWMGGNSGVGTRTSAAIPSLLRGDEPGDEFGWCLSLSSDGNRLAAGGYLHGDKSGLVRVLDWREEEPNGNGGKGGAWTRASKDVVGEPGDGTGHHCSLAGGGNLVAVGSMAGNERSTGLVRVFEL